MASSQKTAGPLIKQICQATTETSKEEIDSFKSNISFFSVIKYIFQSNNETISLGFFGHGRIAKRPAQEFLKNTLDISHPKKFIVYGMQYMGEITEDDKMSEENYTSERSKYERNLRALLKAKNFEDCLDLAAQFNMTEDYIKNFKEVFEKQMILYRKAVSNNMNLQIQKFLKANSSSEVESYNLRHYKEFETQTHLSKMQDNEVSKDLVFVFHASQKGHLVDSLGLTVPPMFFDQLLKNNTQIRSVIIYSCYPDAVAEYYKAAFERLSVAGVTLVFPQNAGLLQEQDIKTIPIDALSIFLQKTLDLLSRNR